MQKKSEEIALFDDMHANKLRDDMPLLSQWIKKSNSYELAFLAGVAGFASLEPPAKQSTGLFFAYRQYATNVASS